MQSTKTICDNKWTRLVLKSSGYSVADEARGHGAKHLRSELMHLKQERSLKRLLEQIDAMSSEYEPSKGDAVVEADPHGAAASANQEESDGAATTSMIPRLARKRGSKRGSLEIPADMAQPRRKKPTVHFDLSSRRKQKTASHPEHVQPQPAVSGSHTILKSGAKVKVVQGAKKHFLGCVATVEKFLVHKRKYGLVLKSGKRIMLARSCLRKLVQKRAPKRMARAKIPSKLDRFMASLPNAPKNAGEVMVAACAAGRLDVIRDLVLSDHTELHAGDVKMGGLQALMNENLLHICITNFQTDCALMLLKMGVETSTRDAAGWTPLMLAAKMGMASVVDCLCQAGAHVNTRNLLKQTALMIAAITGRVEVVDTLLNNGANIAMVDDQGKNALAMAMATNDTRHKMIVDKLIERMYNINVKQEKLLII